jgi:hypothetical protein
MEKSISKIEGVESVTIGFISRRLTIEAPEEKFEDILNKASKAIKKYEKDCEIVR